MRAAIETLYVALTGEQKAVTDWLHCDRRA